MLAAASTIVYIEAETAEEAYMNAIDTPTICAQCSGWGTSEDNTGIELGDWFPDEDSEPWQEDE